MHTHAYKHVFDVHTMAQTHRHKGAHCNSMSILFSQQRIHRQLDSNHWQITSSPCDFGASFGTIFAVHRNKGEKYVYPFLCLTKRTSAVHIKVEDETENGNKLKPSNAWSGIINEGRSYIDYCYRWSFQRERFEKEEAVILYLTCTLSWPWISRFEKWKR